MCGGGGGAGGIIYFKGASPAGTISVTAGSGGLEFNRDGACNAAIPGLNGSNGSTQTNYSYRIGSVFGSSCGALLPSKMISFRAILSDNSVLLNWTMLNPELVEKYQVQKLDKNMQWLSIIDVIGSDDQTVYNAIDPLPTDGDNLYRIRVLEKNSNSFYSATRYVLINSKNLFKFYPNPAHDKIHVFRSGTFVSKLRLLDINGKILLSTNLYQSITELRLPLLSKGVYIIMVDNQSQKLIIE